MRTLRRVLIVQPYGIGDLLFVTPVLRALRTIPTVEKVDLLLGSRTEEIVRRNPHVDEIISIDKDLFHQRNFLQNLKEMTVLGRKLRSKKYDLLLDYSLRGEYAFFSQFFLNIPRRAGFAYKRRAFFHNIRLPLQEGYRDRHVTDYVCDLAELAGVRVDTRFLEFYTDECDLVPRINPEDQNAIDFSKRYIVVSPGGGESWGKDAHFKRWPVRYFAELINRLKDRFDFESVVILGSVREYDLAETLSSQLKVANWNSAGKLNISQVAAVIEKAVLFLGNDGGLVHLAQALKVPLVALYGPVDPAVYGPYPTTKHAIAIYKHDLHCRPCYQKFRYRSDCLGRECLQDLTPQEVFSQLQGHDFYKASQHVY